MTISQSTAPTTPHGSPGADAGGLHALASDVRMACQHVSRRVRFDNAHEVAPHQFGVLAKLLKEPRTAGELAALEQVSAPSMTRTLNGLCKAGLAQRSDDPTDGRRQVVTLTDEGRAVVDRTIASRDDWMVRRLEGLSAHELAVLREATDLLERVIQG